MKTRIFSQATFFILLSLSMLFLISCAVNPVTGKKELSLLSYKGENSLGRRADQQIVSMIGLYYEKPAVGKYVNELGQEMAIISHRPFLQYHFRVLDSPVVNAFALPGGYVYVTRGLLAYMNSEAELAGVEGHEIGHITARHAASQYTKAQLSQIGFGMGSILFPPSVLVGNAVQAGVGLLFLGFSRGYERQADSLGVEYSSRIGYDAGQMAHFFTTLHRLQEQSGQGLPDWLSTHPDPEDREVATLRMATRWQKKWQRVLPSYTFKVERDHYLDTIDGLVFGPERRRGLVRNGYFYHALLDYQFPIPEGWQLMNSPQQIQMINNSRTAVIELTLSQQPSAKSAAEKLVADARGKIIHSERATVNGYTTEIREIEMRREIQTAQTRRMDLPETETFKLLAYFIEKDGQVYAFQALCRRRYYRKNESSFKYTMNNFDRLKNQEIKNMRPTRIKVVRVTQSTTLQDFLARYPNDQLSKDRMAILNGMNLTDRLQPADRIKILTN
ncbi:MAG: M48 family metalloprotease [bacterium]